MTYKRLILWSYTLALAFAAGVVLWQWTTPADAHSWYPHACCSDDDCAPALHLKQVPEGRIVTSKHGSVLVPTGHPIRESQDSDFHVCMQPNRNMDNHDGGMTLICWFEPSGS